MISGDTIGSEICDSFEGKDNCDISDFKNLAISEPYLKKINIHCWVCNEKFDYL